MLTPRYLIGFTGHRSGYDENLIRPALTQTLTDLKARAAAVGGQAELYASVAEGSDTLCVEVARELGLPVHLLLPLEETEFAKDFSTPAAWKRSQTQLITARQRPGRGSVHLVSGEATRPECYFNQAMHMLDAVDVVIALWDGQPARGLGGTAQVIAQAQAIGTPVVQISSATGAVTGTEALNACFKPDAIMTELNQMIQHAGKSCATQEMNPDGLQQCLDRVAVTEAGRFRPSLVRIILLHGIAALLAAVVTYQVDKEHWFYHNRWIFTATELVLVVSALWMTIRLHQKHTQEAWVHCRFACELVRGLRASVPVVDPLHPSVTRHDPQWRRFALSVGLLVLEHQHSHDPRVLRDDYLATRLGDTHPESQILHYQAKRPLATRWWNVTGFVGTWSARLAPVFVLLSLLNKFSDRWNPGHGWHLESFFQGWVMVVLLPIALPLLAGVASGIRQALDAGRRKERYPQMVARLTEIKQALPGLQTASSIRRTVTHSEEILLDELIEWQLAVKNTGAH
jgi:fumarate reductase subunit D